MHMTIRTIRMHHHHQQQQQIVKIGQQWFIVDGVTHAFGTYNFHPLAIVQ